MPSRVPRWTDRHRYQLGAAAVAGGLALAPSGRALVATAGALLAAALVALGRPRLAALCAGLLVIAAGVGELRLRAIDAPGTRLAPFQRVDERATLLEHPRTAGMRAQALVRLDTGLARGARLLAVREAGWPGPASPGAELRVRGVAKPPVSTDDGFDWPAYLRRRGVAYELELSTVAPTGRRRGGLASAVDTARTRAERTLAVGLPDDRAALLRGMVLGEDAEIDALTRDDWRDSGLAHLLAVSGQNVMLLCALALPLLALAGAPPRARVAILLALVAVYVPLAGAGPSLQRAGVMGAAGLLALAASRPASASYGLLLAAVVTLAVNPRVSGDPGWQLSFAAVAGILLARPLAPRSALAGAAWLTGVAALATTPLLALHFGAVPLVSIPANLLALPAVAPVMWIGMIEAALGQLAALGPPGEAIAHAGAGVLALLADPLLAWLQGVATRTAELPHAVAAVHMRGALGALLAYVVIGVLAWAAARIARRTAPALDGVRARLSLVPRSALAGPALVGAIAGCLLLVGIVNPAPPSELTVSFLDVGQGDATLIQHPDGSAILFDGGRPEARVARLLHQAGVRRLSAVVATHQSADHHGGLTEVLRRFPVDLLLDGGDGTRDPTFRQLLAEARARGVRIVPALAGQRLRAGGLTVRVLSPPPRPPGPPPEDPNPRAVIAIVSSGAFDLMLSADAESPSLAPLDLPHVEAMKVPHHGSADPGLPAVLDELRPRVAVIEVGEGNSYGHPDPTTLEALERVVPDVRRTDRDGTVRLAVSGGRMWLD